MKTTIKESSPTKVIITVTALAEDLEKYKVLTIKRLAKDVKVPGFRAGKVPEAIAEKNLDANYLQGQVLEEAINHLYLNALNEIKVKVVSQPQIAVTKFVPYSELEFTAEVDIVPKIKLPDYKNVKVNKEAVKITDADVEEVLNRIHNQQAVYSEVSRAAKIGDRAMIDFAGKDIKGEPIPNGSGKDYPLVLGSNSFITGFEEQIVGLKKGAKKSFELTFPKDYFSKALAGQKVTFDVEVKKIEEAEHQELNDAFAAKIGPFKTIGDLKADIRKQLNVEREHHANRAFEEAIMKELGAKTKVALPQGLLDEQSQMLDKEFRQNLSRQGQTFEDYLKSVGKTEEEYKINELQPIAEERLKIGLILAEIAKTEEIHVTPEELQIRVQLIKNQYKDEKIHQELEKLENQQDIASRMITEKTITKLVGYAEAK